MNADRSRAGPGSTSSTCEKELNEELSDFRTKSGKGEKVMKRVSLLPSGKALRFLTGTVGIAAAIAAANPGAAQASTTPKGTTAAAKIVNQVAVTYYDNTGVGTQYTRKAATTVTVALVQSPLNVAALTANTSIDAGGSAVYNYTIT